MKNTDVKIEQKMETSFSERRRRFSVMLRKDRKFAASFILLFLSVIILYLAVTILPVSSYNAHNPFSYETTSGPFGSSTSVSYGMYLDVPSGSYVNLSYNLGQGVTSNLTVTAMSFSPFGLGPEHTIYSGKITGLGIISYNSYNSPEEVTITGTIEPGSLHPNANISITASKYYTTSINGYILVVGILLFAAFFTSLGIRIITISKNPEAYFYKIDSDSRMKKEHRSYKTVNFMDKVRGSKYPNPLIFFIGGFICLLVGGYLSALSGILVKIGFFFLISGWGLVYATIIFFILIVTGKP